MIACQMLVAVVPIDSRAGELVSKEQLEDKISFDALTFGWIPLAGPKEQLVNEQQCSALDNRDSTLQEERIQGALPWCFGYVAADLLSHKLKQRVSAVDIVLSYNQLAEKQKQVRSSTRSGGGRVDTAIALMSYFGGICLEADLPSAYHLNGSVTLKGLLDELENYSGSKLSLQSRDSFRKLFPHLDSATLLDTALRTPGRQRLRALSDLNCAGRRVSVPKDMKVAGHYVMTKDGYLMLRKADEILKRKSIAAFGFSPVFLLATRYKAHARLNGRDHFASIVGRRWNQRTQSCDYVIRNTWDHMDCNLYNPKAVTCDPAERGYVAVSEDILAQEIETLYYIQ